MDVKRLEKFFDYSLFLDKDPSLLLDKIIQKAQTYLPEDQIPLILKAYEYAADKHRGQMRLS